MNAVLDVLLNRRSVRAYEERPVPPDVKTSILNAAMRAPTAGNMMLYSIVDVTDQRAKDTLARTCDNQPFIATAPLLLLFLADCQRWYDYFIISGLEGICERAGGSLRKPQEGDLLLACCDALIAAQTAVIAADSLGLGSCYIGDILENCEAHRELLDLPDYALPICLVCFGYPTKQQRERPLSSRFGREFIVFENRYRRLSAAEFGDMFRRREEALARGSRDAHAPLSVAEQVYALKFNADFAQELNRSVRAMLSAWRSGRGDGEADRTDRAS